MQFSPSGKPQEAKLAEIGLSSMDNSGNFNTKL